MDVTHVILILLKEQLFAKFKQLQATFLKFWSNLWTTNCTEFFCNPRINAAFLWLCLFQGSVFERLHVID